MQTFAPGTKPLQTTSPAKHLLPQRPRQRSATLLPFSFSKIPIYAPSKRDTEVETRSEAAPAVVPPTVSPDTQPTLSGIVPDVVTPSGEGRTTAPEVEAAPDKADAGIPIVANIRINSNPSAPVSQGGNKTDAVVSAITQGALSQPPGGTLGADEFGTESFEPTFTGTSYAFAGGKCTITTTFNPICPWTTQSRGRTDVPTATDPIVTKDSWPDIKSDLTPRAASPHKSPRTAYYSQSLVERHEKFHGTDDNGWVTSSGLDIVKAKLEAGTVASATAAAEVAALVEAARVKVVAENFKWYKGGGAAHDSFAGEVRAYADGQPEYQKLADAVEKQGKALAAPPPAAP